MHMKQDLLHQRIERHVRRAAGTFSIALSVPNDSCVFIYNSIQLPSASLIKVFIMAEAFRQANSGSLDLSQSVAVTADVQVGGAGPLEHACLGTKYSLLELIKLMIVESDNTATNILIKILGMDSVNTFAHNLGCFQTSLGRLMMDFSARAKGMENYTSPTDMNIILNRLYAGNCINQACDQVMIDILLGQTDKCKLPLFLPSGISIAHKTGELDGIEHDSGIVFCKNPYILTIMTANLPEEELGRKMIAELSLIIFETLND